MHGGNQGGSRSDSATVEASSSQNASRRRQQVAEVLRNKGVICEDFLVKGTCPRSPFCPYMHIRNGEVRPVPWSVCAFFNQGVCLRDRCTFFHGCQEDLNALRSQKLKVYRPQDYMKIARPPPQFLTEDGNLSTQITNEQLEAARAAKASAVPPSSAISYPMPPAVADVRSQRPIYVLPQPTATTGQALVMNTPVQMMGTPQYASMPNYAYMTTASGLPMVISTSEGSVSSGPSVSFNTQSTEPSFGQYPVMQPFTQPAQPTYHLYRLQ